MNLILSILFLFSFGAWAGDCDSFVLNAKAKLEDKYYWMHDPKSPALLEYLAAENERVSETLAPTAPLQEVLADLIVDALPEQFDSFPVQDGEYAEWTSQKREDEFPVLKRDQKGDTQVMLDVNELAKAHPYYEVAAQIPSPNNRYLAYSEDTEGRRLYTIHVHEVDSNRDFLHSVHGTSGKFVWADDNQTIFYITKDPVTLRPNKLMKWVVGGKHELVYEEKDAAFVLDIQRNGSGRYIQLIASSPTSSEVRLLHGGLPDGQWLVYKKREPDVIYELEEGGDRFFVRTNWQAKDYQLMSAPLKPTEKQNWKMVIPMRAGVTMTDVVASEHFLAIKEWENGDPYIRAVNRDTKVSWRIDLPPGPRALDIHVQPEYNVESIRFHYSTPLQPPTEYDYYLKQNVRRPISREYAGEYDPAGFEVKREWVTAADGTRIPITLLMKKGVELNGKNPVLVQAYGAYGDTETASDMFHREYMPLVKRGFIIAYAHVRGGGELGADWYNGGRLENKENTFNDFIAVAEDLIARGYTSPPHMYATAMSAGGLLLGTVANRRPELFNGMIVDVPFVDVMNTMLNPDLPLTTLEYGEWGNPNEKEAFERMLKYSPYDNVKEQSYPHMFVTGAFNDSQVPYWEPAKWVAKIREKRTGDNLLLLRTYMNAGHDGPSGRLSRIRATAEKLAFLLHLEGIQKRRLTETSGN